VSDGTTVKVLRRVGIWWVDVATTKATKGAFTATATQTDQVITYFALVNGKRSPGVTVDLSAPVVQPAPSEVAPSEPAPSEPAPSEVAPSEPASSDAAPATPDCGGVTVRKADGTSWRCTFDDEFDGTSLDRSVWVPQTNFVTGTPAAHACYRDDPANVSVSGGTLNLTVRKETSPVRCVNTSMGTTADYSSGMVTSYRLWSQQYGRFETRFKVPATTTAGLQEDFWLWPDDRYSDGTVWPAAGEIDVAELYSQYAGLNVPFLHYTGWDNWGPVPGLNTSWTCAAARGVFNTYTLEWTATRLSIAVNGKTCLTNTSADQAFNKRYIMAFTQALGTGTNALTASTPIPSTMNVDYVRVWS
jgi:beta-glucanase (GH16 family)